MMHVTTYEGLIAEFHAAENPHSQLPAPVLEQSASSQWYINNYLANSFCSRLLFRHISSGIKWCCEGSNPALWQKLTKWVPGAHTAVVWWTGCLCRASNTQCGLTGMGNDITGLPAHSDPQTRAEHPAAVNFHNVNVLRRAFLCSFLLTFCLHSCWWGKKYFFFFF